MRLIIGIILTLGSIMLVIFWLTGENPIMFTDSAPLLLVFVPTWGALLIGFKGRLIKSITSIWKTDVDSQTLGQCAEVWRASIKYAISFSFIGALLNSIMILANLDDLSKLAPMLSVVPKPTLCALLWWFVVARPITHLLEAKQEQNPTT